MSISVEQQKDALIELLEIRQWQLEEKISYQERIIKDLETIKNLNEDIIKGLKIRCNLLVDGLAARGEDFSDFSYPEVRE